MATRRTSLTELQQQEASQQEALAKKKAKLAVKQAELRAAEQKALTRKRFVVGKLVLAQAPLAALSLEQLQECLRRLAWCVEDEGRFQTWLRETREGAAPELEQGSVPGIAHAIRENGTR